MAASNPSIFIFCHDIWVPQEVNRMWLSCLRGTLTFDEAASECDYNLQLLIVKGFNSNFLGRGRWFDIKVMQKLNLVGQNLKDFACKDQIRSWRLTKEEQVQLGLRRKR